jgi:hypothetical protein
MRMGVPDVQRWKGTVSRGILMASIPIDVKEMVLLDNLSRKGLASTDHHLRNIKIRWPDPGKRNQIMLVIVLNPHPPPDNEPQKES